LRRHVTAAEARDPALIEKLYAVRKGCSDVISAAAYYYNIAKPTAEQFFLRNNDLRLAMLSCMSTLHIVDYVYQNRVEDSKMAWDKVRQYTDNAIERCFAFKVVCGFALASKHCRLSQEAFRNFPELRQDDTTPATPEITASQT
jgi:hypothetical protein